MKKAKSKRKYTILILFLFILVILYLFLIFNKPYKEITANTTYEKEFQDIEFCYPSYLNEQDLDIDTVIKSNIEEFGKSNIHDKSKHKSKVYLAQKENQIGYIFLEETSEYLGYDHDFFSDAFIIHDIIHGITDNKVNVKFNQICKIVFQDGNIGYMLLFMNRLHGTMYYEINVEFWNNEHFYTFQAVNEYNWEFLMDEMTIILGSLKNKNSAKVQDMILYPITINNSNRVNDIVVDYVNLYYLKLSQI